MGAVASCFNTLVNAITSCFMFVSHPFQPPFLQHPPNHPTNLSKNRAIVNGIVTVVKAIINGIVAVFRALVSCLTCGKVRTNNPHNFQGIKI
jgi:hypothetical protein